MRKAAIALLVVTAIVVGMEFYTRMPLDVKLPDPGLGLPEDARTVVIVAHGSVDGDNPLFPAIVDRISEHYAATGRNDVAVRFLHWAPWSDQRLRAVATAEQLGTRLGKLLASHEQLLELQLITHSSGAYIADALCESYRRQNRPAQSQAAHVTMVFLDPFQLHGFVDWRHGARNHGRCADFAIAVINTDDVAPATNVPLEHAWNIDVTAQPGRATFPRNGHYWPLQYYLDVLPGLAGEPLEGCTSDTRVAHWCSRRRPCRPPASVHCHLATRLTETVWPVDEIPLDEIHTDGAQGLEIGLRLNLFGNHAKTENARHARDRAHQLMIQALGLEIMRVAAIDLQVVDRQVTQSGE